MKVIEQRIPGLPTNPHFPPVGSNFQPVDIYDPHGLGRSVFPLIVQREGIGSTQIGAVFAAKFKRNPVPEFITAAHLFDVDHTRFKEVGGKLVPIRSGHDPERRYKCILRDPAVVFGTVHRKNAAFDIDTIEFNAEKEEDSSSFGAFRLVFRRDFATVTLRNDNEWDAVPIVPLPMSARRLWVGESVYAVGFPNVPKFMKEYQGNVILSEGMCIVEGKVSGIYPFGTRNVPGPCISVSAYWPPGMSGGPVLDSGGSVVGIVSYGTSWVEEEDTGKSFAAVTSNCCGWWTARKIRKVEKQRPGYKICIK